MHRTVGISLGVVTALATAAAPALAATPHRSSGARHFTETEAGVQLSSTGNRFEDTFKVKSSPFGAGSVIRDFTLTGDRFPASGKDTATSYYRDGRLIANETVTLGTPLTDGVGVITGTGTCQGGSEAHANETCTYSIKGNYDLITGRVFMTLSGTYTPSTTSRKK